MKTAAVEAMLDVATAELSNELSFLTLSKMHDGCKMDASMPEDIISKGGSRRMPLICLIVLGTLLIIVCVAREFGHPWVVVVSANHSFLTSVC